MLDPDDCRQRALRFAQLAQTAQSARVKERLLELTTAWLALAAELEETHALLDDLEPQAMTEWWHPQPGGEGVI